MADNTQLTIEIIKELITDAETRLFKLQFNHKETLDTLKQLLATMRREVKLLDALKKIDWYFQISDNHPMIQKNVQICRKLIADLLSEYPYE